MANVSIWHAVYLFRKDYFLILHVRVTPVALLPVTHTFIIKKWFKIIKGRYALNDDFSLSNARLFTPLCYVHSFTFSSSFLSISTFAIYKILQKFRKLHFCNPFGALRVSCQAAPGRLISIGHFPMLMYVPLCQLCCHVSHT